MSTDRAFDTAILDLDGTLVDSVYQHVVAWRSAFLAVGMEVPAARIHRAIGMGGDRLVAEVAGQPAETAVGDEVRSLHGERFTALQHQVTPTEGARALLEVLREHGLKVVVASSGEREQTEQLLELVGAEESLHDFVSGSDADASKPAPDLIDRALELVGGESAFMVGDAVWDIETAAQRHLPCVALLTGGLSAEELRQAGAAAVVADPAALADDLDDVLAALADLAPHREPALSGQSSSNA
ncbi:HAD family hydrolase [Nocardioides sp. GCM10027113]|uniref:HAD family hydrolase n=1 Tax=unclassified Nocardioides TaxID=2615069 RepID=UPI0036141680